LINVALLSIAEEQLAKVDAQYCNAEESQQLRVGAIEDKILSFQRQLEERSHADLNKAVCFIHFVVLSYISLLYCSFYMSFILYWGITKGIKGIVLKMRLQ